MKYLIPLLLLLTLSSCYTNPPTAENKPEQTRDIADSFLDKPLKGRVSQYGLYKLVRSGGLINDPNSSTGKAVSQPVVQQIKSTERIPLIKGAQMYLQYRIWSLPEQPAYVDLRRVIKHPKMTLPDGSVSTGSDTTIKRKLSLNQVIAFTGYGLDEDYELVEGDWIFEIWYQDRKLIEKKFTTYTPDKEDLASFQVHLKQKTGVNPDAPKKPFSRFNWPGKG